MTSTLIPSPGVEIDSIQSEQTKLESSLDARRVAFVITSMHVGGAETLLVNLVRRLDRARFAPEIVCLKELGSLGEELAHEIPLTHSWLSSKYDLTILPRLTQHFRRRKYDAVITVGAGDKMFWGRLAARLSRVPVIASALHSTGWPDGVGRLNRCLTAITDAFIAVADSHGKFMVDFEGFPKAKVNVIRNGIDTHRFVPNTASRSNVRRALGLDTECPVVGIVAALRPEKNHRLFVETAAKVHAMLPSTHFLIIGDGPERSNIQETIAEFGMEANIHLLGSRSDTPQLLAALDLFLLTSHNEANPVSILEALACGVPVVSTRVGSIAETVIDSRTGFTVEPGNAAEAARRTLQVLLDASLARRLGEEGSSLVVKTGSLEAMVDGYQNLIERIYQSKQRLRGS